jgi:HAMP domain-containing protein
VHTRRFLHSLTVLRRRLRGVWRHASFSVKFSAVMLVAGIVIAVVPLLLAQANTRGQAVGITAWQPILLLIALILVAMLFTVVVVQTSLQRPLRRLDRAVAALGRGDFNVPVPAGADDELGRLGTTFEAMRRQLRATIRATEARAAVATELSAAQPLETSLRNVCAELRHSIEVDAAIIVVTSSEMSDPFSIVNGVDTDELDALLSGDGPLGEGYRH